MKARAGSNRAMLYEQSSRDHKAQSNLAQLKAWKKMSTLLTEAGEDANKYLPAEAKELLEEDKYISTIRNKYQRDRQGLADARAKEEQRNKDKADDLRMRKDKGKY